MSEFNKELKSHLLAGATTLCHCWAIERQDGKVFAFTDHDMPLEFEGLRFLSDSGLSAFALAQSTGLSVDNTEALGAMSHASIRDDEVEQGRFDGAEVRAWLVNWADVSQRMLNFRGHIGDIVRSSGAFKAELRGLTEGLNRPLGRVFQKPCSAVLGDKQCRFDRLQPGYSVELAVEVVDELRRFRWSMIEGFDPSWFEGGRFEVLDGPAAGLWSLIKHDRDHEGARSIELWEPVRAVVSVGTKVRLTAGCDKRFSTCRLKFNNAVNYQGFPDLPGDDWLVAVPRANGANTGGTLR